MQASVRYITNPAETGMDTGHNLRDQQMTGSSSLPPVPSSLLTFSPFFSLNCEASEISPAYRSPTREAGPLNSKLLTRVVFYFFISC